VALVLVRPKGTQGPIPTQWNVRGWPTLYVIDHKV
jgi:hypothetical protein